MKLAQEVDVFIVDQPSPEPGSWLVESTFHQALVDLADIRSLSVSHQRAMRRNYFFVVNSPSIRGLSRELYLHTDYVEELCTDDKAKADRAIRNHYSPYRMLLEEMREP